MSVFKIDIIPVQIPLKRTFGISRGSKDFAKNVILRIEKDGISGFGEAAPNYRYDEYQSSVIEELSKFDGAFELSNSSLDDISTFLNSQAFKAKAARVALEMALIDWLAKSKNIAAYDLLGIQSGLTPSSSYTIGIDTLDVIKEKVLEVPDAPILKVKLGTDHDRKIIETIRSVSNAIIRVDANEGWKDLDTAKREIGFLQNHNVEIIEQPMPSNMQAELADLKNWSPITLCADESFTSFSDLDSLSDQFHCINIKLMKTGSIIDSVLGLKKAHELGLSVMVGCMVESSLAISAGALVGFEAEYVDLDGHLLIANDPFTGLEMNDHYQIIATDNPGLGLRPNAALFS